MFEALRKLTGTQPIYHEEDDAYTPSKATLATAVKDKTDYDHTTYANAYTGGDKKVLVLCVDQVYLECANGKKFRTGNHPVEMFVVLLHLEKAGFGIDIATLSGDSAKLELFAIPSEDEAVLGLMERLKDKLEKPLRLKDVAAALGDDSPYIAVYIPGGHGAIMGLPRSTDTKAVLQWFIRNDRHVITICHGPASLLSLNIDENPADFPFKGYKMALFPDGGDRIMAGAGYLPGQMPWFFGKKLEELGVEIISKLPVGVTHVDRKLISGDTPAAANKLGRLAAETVLDSLGK